MNDWHDGGRSEASRVNGGEALLLPRGINHIAFIDFLGGKLDTEHACALKR